MSYGINQSRRARGASRLSRNLLCGASLAAAVIALGPSGAYAADRYWDANGTAVGTGGTGTWNLGNLNWSPSGDGVSGPYNLPWNNGALDNAIFGGTAGTVTLGAPIVVHNLTFNVGGFTIADGVLTLSGASPTIAANNGNTTIASVVAGTAGLTKTGNGALTLEGVNTFTGAININVGSIYAANDAALGNSANAIFTAGGLLTRLSIGGVSTNRTVTIGDAGTLILEGTGGGSARITGNGNVRVAASSVTMSNDASTYTGQTIFSGCNGVCSTRFTSVRNLGEASSLGAPVTVADGTIVFNQQSQYSDSLIYLGDGDSSDRNWDINGNGAIIRNQGSGTLTITGDIDISVGGTYSAETADFALLGTLSGGSYAFGGNAGRAITLGGANSYAGSTNIGAITVYAPVLADTGSLSAFGTGANGGITLSANGTLSYTGAGNTSNRAWTVGGTTAASVSGQILNDGTGALTLSGLVAFGGAANNTLTLGGNYAGLNAMSGVISGTGNLLGNGSGTWLLTGANTYNGTVRVESGTLRAGGAQAFGVPNAAIVNGGSLDLNGFDTTFRSLAGTGGTVALGSATMTVDGTANGSFAGSITGSGGLLKRGTGTLTLTGANTYAGETTVNGGTLALDFSPTGGPVSDILSSASALTMTGGTLKLTGAAGETNSQNFSGLNITAGSNRILAAAGAGGGLNIDLGAITRTGGLIDFTLTGSGALTTSNTSLGGWATVNGTDYAKVVGGVITAFTTADYTTKDDAATWANGEFITDDDGNADSFYGTVAGSVQLGGLRYTVADPVPNPNTITIDAGETLGIDGAIIVASSVGTSNQTITGGSLTGASGGSVLGLRQNGGGTFTIASDIVDNAGAIGFTKAGTGIARLSGANSYTGVTTLSGGRLEITSLANGGTASSIGAASVDAANLVLESGTLAYAGNVDGTTNRGFTLVNGGAGAPSIEVNSGRSIGFAGLVTSPDDAGLAKTGWGELVLSNAANDYIGVTTITDSGAGGASTLSVSRLANGGIASGIGAASNASANLVLKDGGRLRYTGGTVGIDRGFTLANGYGRIDVADAGTTLTISGTAVGAGSFMKEGDGTLVLTGANTYTGDTVVNGGTLRAGSARAFGPGTRYMTVNTGATLDLGGFNISAGGIAGGGLVNLGANTLTTAGGLTGFSGRITGTGGFTRGAGSYTQTFTGCANDYTGITTIAGSLLIDCIADGGIASGIGASGAASANLVLSGGRLTYSGASATTDRGFTLTATSALGVEDAATILAFSGQVVGAGGLYKEGAGTLVLSGANGYTGLTRVYGGTLRAGSAQAFGAPATMILNNTAGVLLDLAGYDTSVVDLQQGGSLGGNIALGGATLTITTGNNSATSFFGGAITGAGSLIKNGTATQRLTSCDSDYNGTTQINGGVLVVSCLPDGGLASSIGTSSAAASSLVLNGGTLRYAGEAGSTNRQFTLGATTGNGLDASGTGAINFTSTAPLTFSSPNTAQTLTLTGTNTDNNILAAQITNNGTGATSLTKTGVGTWILTNPDSSYTGATTISGGVLGVDKLADGGVASSIGASSAAASSLVIGNGSTLRYTGAGDTTNRLFTLSSGVTFIESSGTGAIVFTDTGAVTLQGNNQARTIALGGTNSGNNTLAGSIGNAGNGVTTLAKNDSGTWLLTGNHSYTGSTNINAGQLSIGGGGTTGSIASAIVNNFGTLAFNRSDALTYGGMIVGTGALRQAGAGTTILTGNSSYTGGTTIAAGTLQLGNGGASGSIVGNVVDDGVLAFNRSDDVTFGGIVSGSGDLHHIGAGTTTLTAVNTYGGDTIVRAGGLRLAGGGRIISTENLNIATGTGEVAAVTVDGASSSLSAIRTEIGGRGEGSLIVTNGGAFNTGSFFLSDGSATVTGAGSRVTVGGAQLFGALTVADGGLFDTGTIVLNPGGVVNVGGAEGVAATGAGTLDVNEVAMLIPGTRLNFNHTDAAYVFAPLISGAGTVNHKGPGTTILTASNSYTGGTVIDAGTLQLGNGSTTGSIVGNVDNDGRLVFNRSNDLTFAGAISGSGTVAQAGAGTTILTGNSNYGGGTTISSGALALGNGGTSGGITGNVANDGALVFNRSNDLTFAGVISGSGAVAQAGAGTTILTGNSNYGGGTTISSGALALGNGGTSGGITGNVLNNGVFGFNRADSFTVGGAISGTGSVAQRGSGTTILTGNNSYAGVTDVAAGTLRINGDQSAATGLTTVRSGAALGGSGIVGGSVEVLAGGALKPGNSPGTLTINGNLSLTGGSILDFEFGEANVVGGALNDLINVGGDLVLDGTLNVSVSTGGLFDAGVYRVFNYAGALTNNGLELGTMPAGSDVTIQTSVAGQVNLINASGLTFSFWDGAAGPKNDSVVNGGDGIWQNSSGNNNWTGSTGAINAGYADGDFAVFSGTAGTVTVDNGLGAVTASGMQFATSGYRIAGNPLTLVGPQAIVRVGDGTALSAGYTATIDSQIGGVSQLVKSDLGTLILTGANSYAGGTLIDAGTLVVASDANLGDAGGGITIGSGTLRTTANLATGRAVTLSGAGTLLADGGTTLTVNGIVGGSGSLTKAGAGTLVLTGANNYANGTTISAGTLQVGNGATGSIIGNVLNNGALIFNRSNDLLYAGAVSGTGSLTKNGAGTLTLTGISDYTGVTNVNAGEFLLQSGGRITATAGLIVNGGGEAIVDGTGSQFVAGPNTSVIASTVNNRGTLTVRNAGTTSFAGLDMANGSGSSATFNLIGSGSRVTTSGAVNFGRIGSATVNILDGGQLSSTGATNFIGGQFASSSGAVTVSGSGSAWTLANALNIRRGALTVADGGVATAGSSIIGFNGAGINNPAADMIVTGAGSRFETSGALQVTNSAANGTRGTLTIAQGGVVKAGSGTLAMGPGQGVLNIGGAVGAAATGAGTLDAAAVTTTATSTINFNHDDANYAFAAAVSGAGAVNQTGPGTTILTADSNYTGGTTISDGALQLGNGGTTGSITGDVANDGALIFNRSDITAFAGTISGTGMVEQAGSGTTILTADNGYSGGTTISAGTLQLGDGGLTGGIAGDVLNNGVLAFNRADDVTFGGTISGTGALDQIGAGALILTADNNYTGGTTISGGVLQLGNGGTSGNIAGDVLNNATLIFNRSDTISFAGLISGSGGIEQNGGGTTILTAASDYAGATNVNAGTLLINGDQSAATGLTTVNAGGTLGGTGTIGGDVVIADGGALNPGDAGVVPGTLAIAGNLDLAPTAALNYDFGQANVVGGPFNDLVTVGGDLALGGTLNVETSSGGSFDPGVYRVISYAGGLSGSLAIGSAPSADFYVQTTIPGQVNLVNTAGLTLRYWDGDTVPGKNNGLIEGGVGLWQNSTGNDNWTEETGAANAPFNDGAFAVFMGAAGTVTVDDGLGAVNAAGMQFLTDGYVIDGAAIDLVGAPSAVIRVGDGTAAGAAVTATIASDLNGVSQLVKSDLGTLILTGANGYAGGTAIRGGTLQIAADANLGDAAGGIGIDGGTLRTTADIVTARTVDLGGAARFATDAGTTLALNGEVSGAGGFTKDGDGTLVLAGANSYAGDVAVAAGSLFVNGNQSGATGLTSVASGATLGGIGTIGGNVALADGATLAAGAGADSVGTLTINGNLALSAGSVLDFAFGEAGVAGGALNDLVNVGGNLVLDGTLNVSEPVGGSFGPGVYRVFNYGGALTDNGLDLGGLPGGAFSVQTSIAGQVNLVNTAGLTLNFWDGAAGPKNDGAVDGGDGIWRVGGGETDWTGLNGTVNADYAQGSFAIFSAAPGTVMVDNDGGDVLASGMQFAADGYTITGDALTLTGTDAIIQVGDSSAAGAGYTATVAAELTGSAGLVKTDAGTLILTGANSYAGNTMVDGGVLQISSDANLGDAAGTLSLAGGGLRAGASFTSDRDIFVGSPDSNQIDTQGFDVVLNGVIRDGANNGSGNFLDKLGTGTLTLTGANTYSNRTVIAGGTLALAGAGTIGAGNVIIGGGTVFDISQADVGARVIQLNGAADSRIALGSKTLTLGYDFSFSDWTGTITDGGIGGGTGGQVVVTAPVGAVRFYNQNSYTGGTLVASGTFALAGGGALYAGGAVGVAGGAVFDIAGLTAAGTTIGDLYGAGTVSLGGKALTFGTANDTLFTGAITGRGGSLVKQGAGTFTLAGNAIHDGGTTIAAGTLQIGAGGTTGALAGNVLNNGVLAFDRSDAATFAGTITGSGALDQRGTGTTILTAASNYTGGTTISAGALQLGNGGTSGSITGDVANAGSLVFNRSDAIGFGGLVTGTGSLVQDGTGIVTLTADNSYMGATAVNAGTLRINGDQSAATGLVSVASGATLGGSGIIGGNVTVADGGTLSPGNSPGTLTINGDLSLASGSFLAFEFGEAGVAGGALNDLVTVGGDLVLDGTINVSVSAGGLFDAGIYRVFNYGGALTDNGLDLGTLPGGSAVTVQTSVAGQVNLVNSAGLTLNFWDGAAGPKFDGAVNGGDGVWQNSSGNDNWADANGDINAAYSDGTFAIFSGTGGTVTIDDSLGQVAASGMQFAADGYTITGDALALAGAQATVRVGDGSAESADFVTTIAAELTGSAGLVKTDAGTLILSGANSYAGGTTIKGGTVRIAADSALGDVAGGLSFDGGVLQTTTDLASDRVIAFAGAGTLAADADTTLTLNGALSGVGAFTKAGAGEVVLTADSGGYAGATRVVAGTLAVNGTLGGGMDVAAGARLTGTGRVGAVTNSGTIAPGFGGATGTLTVRGDYAGNGGRLEIAAVLGSDDSATGKLVVEGGTSGTTQVRVTNRGGLGGQTVEGIKIVDVAGASDGRFLLDGDYVFNGEQAVVAGAYGYRLYQGGVSDPADGDWYLRSALLDPGEPNEPEPPLYQPGVPVYEAYGANLQTLNGLPTLQQRIGNRSWAAGAGGEGGGIWGRMEGTRSRANAAVSTSLADQNVNSWKMQLGADHVLAGSDRGERLVAGVTAYYGKANSHVRSIFGNGSIETDGYGLGGTLTWYGLNGFYIDGQAQLSWYRSDLTSDLLGSLVCNNDGRGEALSVEIGKRTPVGGGLGITPQVQMAYSKVRFDRFADPAEAVVAADKGDSLKTRWGLALDHQREWDNGRSHVYGLVNLSYEWLDGARARVSGIAIDHANERLWGELGLGASVSWANGVTLYGEVSGNSPFRDFGDSYMLKANAGVRIAF